MHASIAEDSAGPPARLANTAASATLRFEDLVVDNSLPPVMIRLLARRSSERKLPPDELLTELQCEV